LKVQKIIHLQSLANQLVDVLTDAKKRIESYVLTANATTIIDVLVEHSNIENESQTCQKHGRLTHYYKNRI